MYFYASMKGILFFKAWNIDTTTGKMASPDFQIQFLIFHREAPSDFPLSPEFWLAMFGLFVLGMLSEIVKSFRGCLVSEAAADYKNSENKPILGGRDPSRRYC
eukprot:sb/3478268/